MIKSNLHYFKISIENQEQLDERYMFLAKEKDIEKYVETTCELKSCW